MEIDTVLFWNLLLLCGTGAVMTFARARSAGFGWLGVFIGIMALAVAGRLANFPSLIYIATAAWLVLILVPGLVTKVYFRRVLEQRYDQARKLARFISFIHPADGWRQLPHLIHALELAQQGDMETALAILEQHKNLKSPIGFAAIINVYRITNRWTELAKLESRLPFDLKRQPQLLHALLRARGEIGDIKGMVALYSEHAQQIARLNPPAARDMCRLMLFVYRGKREYCEHLFETSLSMLPPSTRAFWLATADHAAGQTDAARAQLEILLPDADPQLRQAIERRLSQLSSSPVLPEPAIDTIIEAAARDHSHEQSFGAQRTLFSKRASMTQALIALNLVMFAAETWFGGTDNPETLYRLGALHAPSVHAGQWWRPCAAMFLHWGGLHLAMNMFALWLLGPFVEFALGSLRYFFVYFMAGIGSMGLLLVFAPTDQLTVGASGSIMGLIGATGALMLRAWLKENAQAARRRLTAVLLIILMQTAFDSVIPQVSMTAHLSGAIIGFLCTLLVRDRLRPAAPAVCVAKRKFFFD